MNQFEATLTYNCKNLRTAQQLEKMFHIHRYDYVVRTASRLAKFEKLIKQKIGHGRTAYIATEEGLKEATEFFKNKNDNSSSSKN